MYRDKIVVLFGAGVNGVKFLRSMGALACRALFFVDNDPQRWDTVVEGVPVKSPEVLRTIPPEELMVFVVSAHYGAIRRQLEALGLAEDVHFADGLLALEGSQLLPLWREDGAFQQAAGPVRRYTVLDEKRLYILWQLANHCAGLAGQAAEAGVYRGGTAKVLSGIFGARGKKVYCFDTFSGMPDSLTEADRHQAGDFADTSLAAVAQLLADCPGAVLRPGFFPDSAQGLEDVGFAFVHLDMDIYQATLAGCRWFWPRMTPGGILLLDDYGFASCPGVKKAADEYFAQQREKPIYLPTGQAMVIKG